MDKKITLLIALFTATFFFGQEKELNIGINGGITIGDIEPQSSTAFGFDANYLFGVFDDFKVGPSIGAVYYLPKEVNGVKPDAKLYVPIGAAIRFQSIQDAFFVGGDFGYAIGLSPSRDRGGIYFKPMVGYNASTNIKVSLFYSAVKKRQPAYSYIGLALTYNIFGDNSDYYSY